MGRRGAYAPPVVPGTRVTAVTSVNANQTTACLKVQSAHSLRAHGRLRDRRAEADVLRRLRGLGITAEHDVRDRETP
eukprot:15465058-Alexandrium_andersonii.AAC.1